MIDIDYEQYKFLCKINRKEFLQCDSLSQKEKDICEYLMHEDCIKAYASFFKDINGNVHSRKTLPSKIELTPKGKAQIYAFKSTFYDVRTAKVLSVFSTVGAVVSAIVAIIALMQE